MPNRILSLPESRHEQIKCQPREPSWLSKLSTMNCESFLTPSVDRESLFSTKKSPSLTGPVFCRLYFRNTAIHLDGSSLKFLYSFWMTIGKSFVHTLLSSQTSD